MFNLPQEDLLEISSTSNRLNSFNDKSFLITGGTGFIGKWLVASLNFLNTKNDANISITILTRDKKSFFDKHNDIKNVKNLYFVESDVKNLDQFKYEGKEFDYIVIGANDATYDFSLHAFNLTDTLINGTKKILDKFVSIKTQSILHLSSGAVYGDISDYQDGVKEVSRANFDISNIGSLYGLSKILVESVLNEFGKTNNIKIINARCFAFSGPYLPIDKHFAFGNFIKNALENKDIIISGDGSPVRSYLYPIDLVNFLFKLLNTKDDNVVVNVGSSEAITIKDLAYKIQNVLNVSKDVIIETSNVNHPEKSNFYIPNINRANKLGLIENISLQNSIIRTYDFYKKLYY
jgi:nucleoside-diphosphate-sugar epimerase